MAILTAVTIQPHSAEVWDDLQKRLKKIKGLVEQAGGENATVLVTMVGGQATNQLVFLTSTDNWTSYGKIQDAFYGNPEAQAEIAEAAKLATWQTFAAQTLDL